MPSDLLKGIDNREVVGGNRAQEMRFREVKTSCPVKGEAEIEYIHEIGAEQ
jgi:hypothetical protein